jgi:outer membrane lipoprotein-sorting protein
MLRKLLPLLALGLLIAPVSRAQTVDEIVAKYCEAMGGLEKLKALNSMRVTGTMMVGQGMEAPFTMERKRPGKRRLEFTIQGMTGIQAFDGEKAWSVMPFMGKKDPEAAPEEDSKQEKDDADFDGPLVDWKAKGHTVELAGKEAVEGADAYKLKITKKNGDIEYYYLDAETYLLVKNEGKVKRRGTEVEGEGSFSDYKDVDGYMLPFTMEQGIKGAPQKPRMTFTKYELNVPLDDSRFAMPAVAAADSAKSDATKAADAAKTEAVKSADAKATDATKAADAAKTDAAKAVTKKKKKDQ